jgi:preprotein translocase subunit SecB
MKKNPVENIENTESAALSQPSFQIHKLYMKDASFMTYSDATELNQGWKPELQVEINSRHEKLPQENTYEVVLHTKCSVLTNNKKTFEVETYYAGIFTATNINEQQLKHTLGSYCPSILYPYLREVIANLVLNAGFPQLNLAPINFDLLYEQQENSKKAN